MIRSAMGISFEESYAEIDGLWERTHAARRSDDHEAALESLGELLDHPCAHHQVVEHEVLDEMHSVLRELGRFDEAIDAKRAAIAAGYRSSPDPEADIAECLIESGRRAEGDSLFAVCATGLPTTRGSTTRPASPIAGSTTAKRSGGCSTESRWRSQRVIMTRSSDS
jgi:hypothetical protein